MKRIAALMLLVSCAAFAVPPPNTGNCLNHEEQRLVEIVNAYRVQNGRPALQASKWLSTTGQWHVWDLAENNPITATCNMHSWSGARPDLWQAVCYTPDHAQAVQMWQKPSQISAGRYVGNGYENAVSASTADAALAWWQNSPAHNAVILQQPPVWSNVNFTALGVGLWGGLAVLWFGDGSDPDGLMQECQDEEVFANGFE